MSLIDPTVYLSQTKHCISGAFFILFCVLINQSHEAPIFFFPYDSFWTFDKSQILEKIQRGHCLLCLAIAWISLTPQIISLFLLLWLLLFSLHWRQVSQTHNMHLVVSQTQFQDYPERNRLASLGFYFLFLFHLCSSLISFARTGFQTSISEPHAHYTIQGFTNNCFAYQTIHMFSIRRSIVFANSGKVWKFSACAISAKMIQPALAVFDVFGCLWVALGAFGWM